MARRSDLLSGRAATDREAARQGVSSMWKTLANSALCTLVAIAGCVSNDDAIRSNLTPGMVKLSIQKGLTTQAEVMEVFGPPDRDRKRNRRAHTRYKWRRRLGQ